MRIFLTGGTGAIGRALVPRLIQEGHTIVALARAAHRAKVLESAGAEPVVADPLDRTALTAVVRQAAPDVIIHQLTALSRTGRFRTLDRDFALTNRFRTEVTDTLIASARTVGVTRFLAQSFCGWPYARVGGPVKTEDDLLDPSPPSSFRQTLAAIRHLEEAIRQAADLQAVALRYGLFYGPGTAITAGGAIVEMVRRRRIPIVGGGSGIWSFIHIEDAARATLAAISRGAPGIYNIVDDEPAPVAEWLPHLANVLGAKPPMRIPAWIGRLPLGSGGVAMMTEIRGCSNGKAKRELGWQLMYKSWRSGFTHGLG